MLLDLQFFFLTIAIAHTFLYWNLYIYIYIRILALKGFWFEFCNMWVYHPFVPIPRALILCPIWKQPCLYRWTDWVARTRPNECQPPLSQEKEFHDFYFRGRTAPDHDPCCQIWWPNNPITFFLGFKNTTEDLSGLWRPSDDLDERTCMHGCHIKNL